METIRIRAAGILVRDGKILLVQHEKYGKRYWLIPGGGVDFGETVEEALIREYQEEVGLPIRVGPLVMVHDSVPPHRQRQALNLYFVVEAEHFNLQVTSDGVLMDAAFYSMQEFVQMPINPDVKTEILKGLSTHWAQGCQYLGNRWHD